jgi:hypothetical protein
VAFAASRREQTRIFFYFLLDMEIRIGMGRDVNQQNSEPRTSRRLAGNDENPSPVRAQTAKGRLTEEPCPASAKKKAPPWKNLTLDELRSWYENAPRGSAT